MINEGIEKLSEQAMEIIAKYGDAVDTDGDFAKEFAKFFVGIIEMDKVIMEQKRILDEVKEMAMAGLAIVDKGESVYD